MAKIVSIISWDLEEIAKSLFDGHGMEGLNSTDLLSRGDSSIPLMIASAFVGFIMDSSA